LKNLYLLIIDWCVTGIFGGFLLGVRSVTGLAFYDWETLELVRRIEIQPRHVFWSESGELVCLATEESYFILKYDSSVVARAHESKEGLTEDGVEEAFTVSLILLNDVELNTVLFEHPSKISNTK
jgi:coatomer subunit beta'